MGRPTIRRHHLIPAVQAASGDGVLWEFTVARNQQLLYVALVIPFFRVEISSLHVSILQTIQE